MDVLSELRDINATYLQNIVADAKLIFWAKLYPDNIRAAREAMYNEYNRLTGAEQPTALLPKGATNNTTSNTTPTNTQANNTSNTPAPEEKESNVLVPVIIIGGSLLLLKLLFGGKK